MFCSLTNCEKKLSSFKPCLHVTFFNTFNNSGNNGHGLKRYMLTDVYVHFFLFFTEKLSQKT